MLRVVVPRYLGRIGGPERGLVGALGLSRAVPPRGPLGPCGELSQGKSVLIANRGEIAVRIASAARNLGLRSVAVASSADLAESSYVNQADRAVCLGPPAAGDSYLRGDRILEVARQEDAGLIVPGYGFLSENADFVAGCEDAGIPFAGPSSRVMQMMGDKAHAKATVAALGIPVVPGFTVPDDLVVPGAGAGRGLGGQWGGWSVWGVGGVRGVGGGAWVSADPEGCGRWRGPWDTTCDGA